MTAVSPAEIAAYQVTLDDMTAVDLIEEFAAVVRQYATATFGSDLWVDGLKIVPIVKTTLIVRLARAEAI
jgi:hypothetical protein